MRIFGEKNFFVENRAVCGGYNLFSCWEDSTSMVISLVSLVEHKEKVKKLIRAAVMKIMILFKDHSSSCEYLINHSKYREH